MTDREITESSRSPREDARTIAGSVFVDASGDGNLAQAAGRQLSVLPAAERQAATLSMRIGGVKPDAPISSELMRQAVAAHNATSERSSIRDHGPAARLPLSGEVTMQIVDQCVDALDAHDLTRAETAARVQAWDYLNAFRNSMPGWEDAYLVAHRTADRRARDPPHRRALRGHRRLTCCRARRRPEDGIARCGWPLEAHHGIGSTKYTPIEGRAFYDIPLDALRSLDRDNLWAAGRLVSSDADAYCSLRVMGTAFATGQAAGVAAALQAARGAAPEPRRSARSCSARARWSRRRPRG